MKNWLKAIYSKSVDSSNKITYKYRFAEDLPKELDDRTVYIVGEKSNYWMLAFQCPCGCNETISLNLLKKVRPRWRFFTRWSRINIYPSIWRKVGCGSHFYIKKGKVIWSRLKDL
ncbi:MAG TPA: DUF6527 family protein [Cyclobacteriaceae bacterium]|nr:hypothetical protein [Cyclobacteriaceae bacterium]HMV07605.1 DUF6527 family protein [Cyclobacteriaceae bacterium]HMW98740.1 DUF6527 family protein [Cyclobacteriaceae bacterium]HND42825.1 DUF6527 family protein [Cyclobacteriaceae bacterium]HNE98322.1 DUF6527 family protein [Cyclobacteriaceae bacterium]